MPNKDRRLKDSSQPNAKQARARSAVVSDAGMSRSLSVYLDLLRFSAAFAVFCGHLFTNERWSGARNATLLIQNDAVICFFVLSGTVIGYASEQKEHNLGEFLRARLARLWSVAIPALLLTALLDVIGHNINPSAYFSSAPSAAQTLREMLISGLFLNEVSHLSVMPGSNLPYWSLSYEFSYYLLFGFAFYLRGPIRPIAIFAAAVLIGFRILLLLPIWLLGLAVWHGRKIIPHQIGWPLIVASIVLYVLLTVSGTGPRLGSYLDVTLLHDRFLHWSRLAGWKYVLGLLVALNMGGFSALADRVSFGRAERLIRAAAGTTFTLYLFHYPLLCFFGAVAPGPAPGVFRCLEIGSLTLLFIVGIAWLTEHQKHHWRLLIDRLWISTARICNGNNGSAD